MITLALDEISVLENAKLYMDTVIGDVGPASSQERREAFLREGPRMLEWLASLGFRFSYTPGYADDYPELPGGSVEGRSLESDFFDLKKLGAWKNKNLGPIEQPPFFAVRVWPGDLGTKGGLLTNESARVLHKDGSPIKGLYAAGNTSASVMGRTYPGPGLTIGAAMVFGMIAGQDAAKVE